MLAQLSQEQTNDVSPLDETVTVYRSSSYSSPNQETTA